MPPTPMSASPIRLRWSSVLWAWTYRRLAKLDPAAQNNPVILSVMPDAAGDRPARVFRINGRNAPRSPNAPATRPRRAITAEAAHRASSQQDAHRRCERLAVGRNDKTAHSEQECDG